ncbi:FdhD protein [Sphaerotilus sulfidivorans]|uniref:Sulfur carrier protein FdhD n=1 Tax=Sphaerotilus sulfidivorans TaxID=639200 RepID=A0A5C1PZE6_9BURK|nr:formate dehydrogenase accessory sulfurtransferase FdhD [Sphaerotilus sulfidivorans]NZD44391.1 formate dehydrogenase accessory sulfurtransferase FdhD [Sphaerotilus sulfidivorans]QEN00089.1 formate dehydrogenase accessory sulfurtransferase FdhD [Sphaerotilus sulfidivorans]
MHEDDHESLPDPTGTRPVERLQAGRREPHVETLAEELPVALVYNGISHAVMLASPADLEDFALGFSLSEGIIDSPDDLLDAEILPADLGESVALAGTTERGLSVELKVTLRCFMRLKERRRTLAGRTGCGLCGTESLAEAVRPVGREAACIEIEAAALERAMAALPSHQHLQKATGAAHAAAWCAPDGEVLTVREDVGRHNALDKLIGALARAGTDPATGFVVVTSRASYEMVYKAAHAGFGLLAAVSAPTGLAVRTAEAAGLVLAGFVRGDRAVAYSHARRLLTPAPAPVSSS